MISSRVRTFLIATIFPFMISLFIPIPGTAQTPSSNGNTDVFILKTQDATNDLSNVSVISNFDWFNDGDKIGLTDGLTESDLDYLQLMDFDQDGRSDDAIIKIKSTQEILGVVLNADDFVLEGEFVVIPSLTTQPIACLPKANISTCQVPAFNATILPSSSGVNRLESPQQKAEISPKN
ncbi:hypothetical protein PCC9214_04789 [Planktothrix tepida]|uniref:Uncharacterized protein n=2 Tax=Planktothrix TaxID=54304 RepID=A0A1J1LP48_9CYAN|nr:MULTISPECIES: hypothetical protein [Planktothrix]CAD5921035.1 hypothetical protein NO713_00664 [Planktothrix pseudagardhii]CAD5981360.1 hypothetical protein PCC9214_04789 [Planktothrix tepida]CUR33778.1 conserved exported hypothetical protein [Planktothrix tepida PCC 9214]